MLSKDTKYNCIISYDSSLLKIKCDTKIRIMSVNGSAVLVRQLLQQTNMADNLKHRL
jgi:hypothetical protein